MGDTMGEFIWTFAVASVAFLAGYIMCSLLTQDRNTNAKRFAVKYYRAVKRVQEVIDEGRKERGWGLDDDFDAGWDHCALQVEQALHETIVAEN